MCSAIVKGETFHNDSKAMTARNAVKVRECIVNSLCVRNVGQRKKGRSNLQRNKRVSLPSSRYPTRTFLRLAFVFDSSLCYVLPLQRDNKNDKVAVCYRMVR